MSDVIAANPFDSQPSQPAAAGALIAIEQSKAIAEVQAALMYARAQPRDPRRAMDKILQDCMRPGLAEEATYQYSRGGNDISGPSIRLAETLAKRWGNMEAGVKELSRRDGVSECLAYAWDYETNYRDVRTFTVRHWRDTKQGGYALRDERDIYELIANYGARRKRACILALIDGDVVETAVRQCEATLATKVEVNDELIAQMIERFATFGVTKEMIEKRIQRHMSALTPALAVSLKRIYNSLRDGMSTPAEWFEVGDDPAANVAQPAGGGSRAETVKSRMKAKKGAKAAAASEGSVAPQYTYADVADRLKTAKTKDELDAAADLVKSVIGDEALRTELGELYSTLAADFEKGDA
ncbi:hypothetical protein HDG32_005498 [Paraburkholderia sp. CI2]|uniref:hypothetical protein n=1 Tax=Paraburkholderia sp. CI2 TaxID=2723093 RepID=UPI0016138264|nr:hypothetical protein [Paraburkholderia sp. CI2]MBB5469351.1 hypothetical protein [Paraburkholderia sp. CI2]